LVWPRRRWPPGQPNQAIRASSSRPGKLADIVAVKGSPLENVAVLESMDFVMKSGRVAKRDGRMLDMVLE
jgi:hypothetical protein